MLAELREAQRLGLMGGSEGIVAGTPEQEAQIARAGAAAREQTVIAGSQARR